MLHRALRGALGVAAGMVVMVAGVMVVTSVAAALTSARAGGESPAYLAMNLVGSAAVAALGGWLAARIGGMPAGVTLLVIVALLGATVATQPPAPGQPAWYPLVVAAIGPLGVLVGLMTWRWRARARSSGSAPPLAAG